MNGLHISKSTSQIMMLFGEKADINEEYGKVAPESESATYPARKTSVPQITEIRVGRTFVSSIYKIMRRVSAHCT